MRVKKGHVSIVRRIHLLFLIIVILFTIILLRLGYMQLMNASFYTAKLNETYTYKVTSSNPRGKIYDSNGLVLVDNSIKKVISFTRDNKMTSDYLLEVANYLSKYCDLNDITVSKRERIDYYLADSNHYKQVVKKLPNSERFDGYGNNLSESIIYNNAVNSLKNNTFNDDTETLKTIYIFTQLNRIGTFYTKNIDLGNLSEDKLNEIISHKGNLEGLNISEDWQRKSDSAGNLTSIVGMISTEKSGLPKEFVKSYIKKGYSLDDRVGISYLEKVYESYLQGKHTIQTIKVNKKGKVVSDKLDQKGHSGANLKLTIDSNFQAGVDDILKRYFSSELSTGNANLSEGIYAVALEPSTGRVLALSGLSHNLDTNETSSDTLGTFTNSYTPGSVIKAATISSGWEHHVLSGNEVLYDHEIANIKSWFTQGLIPITATQALEYSSNTYMVQIALRLMGQNYNVGDSLVLEKYKTAMKSLRESFAEFGLGTETGFDLSEEVGYLPKTYNSGEVLNESFGQFDAYTTLQLAQYVATIANGGNRLAPHIADGIYDGQGDNLGNLIKSFENHTLNKVQISPEDVELLQEGFYNVVNSYSGYATGYALRSNLTTISGKTGTAETSVTKNGQNVKTVNLNVVAYDQDKKIAVAVMYPHASDDETKASQYIARDIIDLYVSNH